jgi:hypothetical protein
MSTEQFPCPHCKKNFANNKGRNAHIQICPQKPKGLPAAAHTTSNSNMEAPTLTPEPGPIPAPIVATTTRRNQAQSDSSDDDTPQRRVIPRHVPIINNQTEVTRMTVQKYNTVAIQYDEWLNMAKTCRSNNDLTNCVMAQLLDSNATQHKVTLLLDYLTTMMSQQKSEYLHEKQKIDQQFNMYAFTEDQDKLLFEYLPNIYMTNDNTDAGEVSCINTCNVFFCGASNYREKRRSNRNNQRCLNFVEMAAFGSCI